MQVFLKTFNRLIARKTRCLYNAVRAQSLWEWARNTAFLSVGFWMLTGLHVGFYRLLTYLSSVELIGGILIWKLTAMSMLTTFAMVILSSLIISMTTLFYSSDLRFLMSSPVPLRSVFLDKSIETIFFSSWMIGLAIFPFIYALGRVYDYGFDFYLVFIILLLPFLVLAAVLGMAFTLSLMYLFPSSRTRDVVWVLSSLSVGLIYVLLRFSQPERLIRPDALQFVAQYLEYLQAPTAPYAPSWWMTQALSAYAHGHSATFLTRGSLLWVSALAAYGLLIYVSGRIYAAGYSGAQEARRGKRPINVPPTPEWRLARSLNRSVALAVLFWKDRLTFFRDVKYWSQIVLIGALMCVYLFSISRLPLDTPELKSLVCFLNIGTSGFVLSSLGLRFTFPSISVEGRSYWVMKSAPISVQELMTAKFLFSLIPMWIVATGLIAVSNYLLGADPFIFTLSLVTIWSAVWTMCAMGVGLGAVFPRFKVDNIHQVESSAGGFLYMACSLTYVALLLAVEAWPVQMHFQQRLGRLNAWDYDYVALSLAMFVAVNLAGFVIPWWLGRRTLEAYESED
jgi:ABC-2 type transport system permease protein